MLPRAVDSVLAQTMEDFELLVIDDCSSDGSLAWLQARGDARLRVIRRTGRPGGAAPARNLGIRSARAGLIAFQDSDDEWLPRKLERQLAVLSDAGPQVGWVGGAYQVDEQVVSSPRLVQGEGYDSDLVVGAPFVTPTWLVRRECLEQAGLFDESMPCLEDWDLIFKLSAVCRFRAAPEVVMARYGSADSLLRQLSTSTHRPAADAGAAPYRIPARAAALCPLVPRAGPPAGAGRRRPRRPPLAGRGAAPGPLAAARRRAAGRGTHPPAFAAASEPHALCGQPPR